MCIRDRLWQCFAAQPLVVPARPGVTAVVDDPVAKQQLGQPVLGTHQVPAAVLTSTDPVSYTHLDVYKRQEPDEGADGGAGEPVLVADLDRKCEPGQGAHPTAGIRAVAQPV